MFSFLNRNVISTGLAIFSMFFGAGNLMFPLKVGLISGTQNAYGVIGFILTGVLLPFAGLLAIIMFQGDYPQFFYRTGRIPGLLQIFFWTTVVGPLIAMPRIVTLSYTMIYPFLPSFINLFIFSVIFLVLTFLATYKESRIIDLLGDLISPALLITLIIIILKGVFTASQPIINTQSSWKVLWQGVLEGYQTLDILGGILFASIIISILQKKFIHQGPDFKKLAILSFQAGLLGVTLLGIVYVGLCYIGAYFGHGLEEKILLKQMNAGQLFSEISFRILGTGGAAIIALAVILACYSTIIALAAVYAEFLQKQVFKEKINYFTSLILTLFLTLIVSNLGLDSILKYSEVLINITYPALIVLTLCNIAYKLFNFKPVKLPVAITFIISIATYSPELYTLLLSYFVQ